MHRHAPVKVLLAAVVLLMHGGYGLRTHRRFSGGARSQWDVPSETPLWQKVPESQKEQSRMGWHTGVTLTVCSSVLVKVCVAVAEEVKASDCESEFVTSTDVVTL